MFERQALQVFFYLYEWFNRIFGPGKVIDGGLKNKKPFQKRTWNVLGLKWPSYLFPVEWDYEMIFTPELTGSVGCCVVNPNGVPTLPSGVILIAYGWLKQENRPFRFFKKIPFPKHTSLKEWKDKESDSSYEYVSDDLLKIKVVGVNFTLEFSAKPLMESTYRVGDLNMGRLNQHFVVHTRWAKSDIQGSMVVSVDGKPISDGVPTRELSLRGHSYHENSGGNNFLCNSGWLFLVHESSDLMFSYQSYHRSNSLKELLVIWNQEEIKFDFSQLLVGASYKEYKMIDYEQNLPTKVQLAGTNDKYAILLNFDVTHRIESLKSNSGETPHPLFRNFFIIFLTGTFSLGLRSLEQGKEDKRLELEGRSFGGEYAHHNLWLDKQIDTPFVEDFWGPQ
jgi:hypothetical protein